MLDLLKQLYLIHSKSTKEEQMSLFLRDLLNSWNIPFKVDKLGQIYRFVKGRPLLSAHQDQVQATGIDDVVFHKGKIYGFLDDKQNGLGADDKNGLFACLMILKEIPDLSFIFSVCEEQGGKVYLVLERQKVLDSIPFCLVFDRKGAGDIIGVDNYYCDDDLEKVVKSKGKKFGYSPTKGTFSDANEISNHIPTVNLSVGYYNPHSKSEYTVLEELLNAVEFGKALVRGLKKKRYDMPKTAVFSPLGSRVLGKDWKPHTEYNYMKKRICTKCSKTTYYSDSKTCSVCKGDTIKGGMVELRKWDTQQLINASDNYDECPFCNSIMKNTDTACGECGGISVPDPVDKPKLLTEGGDVT